MFRIILLGILFIGGNCIMAKENRDHVFYQLNIKANGMMCTIRINDMPIINTRDIEKGIPYMITLSQPVSEIINGGENILSIYARNAAPYIKDYTEGYCEAKLVASVKNPETKLIETREISQIHYDYVKNQSDDLEFTYLLSTESSLELDPLLTSTGIITERQPNIYDGSKKPVQVELASREFYVNHHQPFSWIHKSTPFEDTPAHRLLLWEKYNEIRSAILSKSKRQFRKLVEPGLTDSAKFKGRSKDQQFEAMYSQVVESFTKLNPATWQPEILEMDDFDLEIYAGGKLFRFNEKKKSMASPLQWYNPYSGEYDRYNPTFTFINGEVVMAFF